jgi:hypothetical protein
LRSPCPTPPAMPLRRDRRPPADRAGCGWSTRRAVRGARCWRVVLQLEHGFQRHPRCDCLHIPTTGADADSFTDEAGRARRARPDARPDAGSAGPHRRRPRPRQGAERVARRLARAVGRRPPCERELSRRQQWAGVEPGPARTVNDFMAHLTSRVDALNAMKSASCAPPASPHRPPGTATDPDFPATGAHRMSEPVHTSETPATDAPETPTPAPEQPAPETPPSRSRPKRSTSGSAPEAPAPRGSRESSRSRPKRSTSGRPTPKANAERANGSRRSRTATSPNSRRRSATARKLLTRTPIERKPSATWRSPRACRRGRRDLSGANEEELAAHADRLLAWRGNVPPTTPRPDPGQGPGRAPPRSDARILASRTRRPSALVPTPSRTRNGAGSRNGRPAMPSVTTPSRSEGARNGRVPAHLPTGSGSDPQGFRHRHRRSARRHLRRGDGGDLRVPPPRTGSASPRSTRRPTTTSRSTPAASSP